MPSIGGFTKTRNYVRRQKALGRYRSAYQIGGTIIGRLGLNPFFPTRARPWEVRLPDRIKGTAKRKPRQNRAKRRRKT